MLGILAIFVLLAFGYQVCRRVLGECDGVAVFTLAPSLGLASWLFLTHSLLSSIPLHQAIWISIAFQALVALVLWKRPSSGPLEWKRDRWMIPVCLLLYLYTRSSQIVWPDEDCWIHIPIQGLLKADVFPPVNPFFPELELRGHYARDLVIAALSLLTGRELFSVQGEFTVVVQILNFLLLYKTLAKFCPSKAGPVFATLLIYSGMNLGCRYGLVNTFGNNNVLVHLYLFTILNLLFRLRTEPRMGTAIFFVLLQGSYAAVYETHFGLTLLATLALAVTSYRANTRTWRLVLSALVLSIVLALYQHGTIARLLFPQKTVPDHLFSQAQVVKLTVPKSNLGQVWLGTAPDQRLSVGFLPALQGPATYQAGYYFCLSSQVLALHFLPTFLAPLVGVYLWHSRGQHPNESNLGLWFCFFGFTAFCTPAVVGFGPIFETESFRWEFAASLGFTAAFGIALGLLYQKHTAKRHRLLAIALIFCLCSLGWINLASQIALRRAAKQESAPPASAPAPTMVQAIATKSEGPAILQLLKRFFLSACLQFPTSQDWYDAHSSFQFSELDRVSAAWLAEHRGPKDRLLMYARHDVDTSILRRSCFIGACGIPSVGQQAPLASDAIATPPYRLEEAAKSFWNGDDDGILKLPNLNWLYFVKSQVPATFKIPQTFELAKSHSISGEESLIYRRANR